VKGRGEKLPISDFPKFESDRWAQSMVTANRILSPQGRLIDKLDPGPDGLYIHVRSLTGEPATEVTFKNLIGEYQFSGWSPDGKGIYLAKLTPSDFMLLYAGLDGHNQVIWKRGTNGGYSIDYPIPSPDGRHLVFTIFTAESNAWILENF
jgi:Tol biopolymer transport system component